MSHALATPKLSPAGLFDRINALALIAAESSVVLAQTHLDALVSIGHHSGSSRAGVDLQASRIADDLKNELLTSVEIIPGFARKQRDELARNAMQVVVDLKAALGRQLDGPQEPGTVPNCGPANMLISFIRAVILAHTPDEDDAGSKHFFSIRDTSARGQEKLH